MAAMWRQDASFYRKYLYNFVLLYKNRQDLKMFVEIILSLVTVSIFIAFAIRPTIITILGLTVEIKTKEDTIAVMDQKIQAISEARSTYDSESEKIAFLSSAIPSRALPQDYIRQIEGLAIKNSVSLDDLSMENVTVLGESTDTTVASVDASQEKTVVPLPSGAKEIPASFSVSGTYPNLLSFLSDVESHRIPVAVDSLNFGTISSLTGAKIILTISLRVPYL